MRILRKIHLQNVDLRLIFSFLGLIIILFFLVSVFSPPRASAAPAGCWPAASCCSEDCSSCCSSFLPGTDITIDQNGTTVDVEKLEVGDVVLSFIEGSQQTKVNKLTAIRKSKRDYYFIVTAKQLAGKREFRVKASANHPFYVANNYQSWDSVVPRGYKRTDELEIGNKVYVLNKGGNNLSEAIISQVERIDKPTEVYSLTVENESNYFAEQFAVHNKFCSADFCGWDPPSCTESNCNGTNCDTQGACAAASTCWADSPCYCSPVDNSQCAPPCDSRNGQECGTYGCCSANNVESECYKQYNCSGECVYGGLRREGDFCGNGACACNENSSNCAADCGAPPPTCPNGACDNGETCFSCTQDCGTCPTPPPTCPNGSCDGGESCSTCPQDCGSCSTPPPTPPPGCDSTPLTITPNPANVGATVYFKYNPGQDTYIGGDTWNPSTSVSNCREDSNLLNRRYICTAAAATTTGVWTHKWNNQSCSKTSPTYVITNPPAPVPMIAYPACIFSGYTGTEINISWATTSPLVTYVDISRYSDFRSYYHKQITGGATQTNGTGFNGYVGVSGTLTYNPQTTYYVRTYNGFRNSNSDSLNITACASPTGLSVACNTIEPTARFAWNGTADAIIYGLRIDDTANGWTASCSPPQSGDFCFDQAGTSKTVTITPGDTYNWGVAACNNTGCSPFISGTSFACPPAPPTGLSASCPVPGSPATVSWSPSTGATVYALRVDNLADPWDGSCSSPAGDFCSNETGTSKVFTSTPGGEYRWWVHACNAAGCSNPTFGSNFNCGLPSCPGGLGNCGGGPPPPRPETIGSCSGNWVYNPGPPLAPLAYNIWCAENANPTRGYCYQCNTNITPWIQVTGDVHSNAGINAPGGP